MTAPAKPGFQVATDTLRTEAGVWDELAKTMSSLSTKADTLRFPGTTGGPYGRFFIPAYTRLTDMVVARCKEGHDRMVEIGTTLREIARIYEQEEMQNEHNIRRQSETR
jgi:hypothetical protein